MVIVSIKAMDQLLASTIFSKIMSNGKFLISFKKYLKAFMNNELKIGWKIKSIKMKR